MGKVQSWLDAIAEKDPARALDLFVRLLEYHVPKLARTEGKEESHEEPPLIRVVFVPPPDRMGKPDTAPGDLSPMSKCDSPD